MSERDDEQLARRIERIERHLPDPLRRLIRWLRQPSSRWVRLPAGIVLIAGGLLGFLPVLGLWMIPLGLLLLAQDLPFLRRPMRCALDAAERGWIRHQAARRRRGRR